MKLLNDSFSTGQASAAADIATAALQTYIRRGMIVGHKGEGVHMPGTPAVRRSFSFFNVMEIAIAAALIKAGVDVAMAFRVGAEFAHSGDETRTAGFPFYGAAETVIGVSGERFVIDKWQTGSDVFCRLLGEFRFPEAVCILRVNPVFERVALKLGYHPEKVRDEAHEAYEHDDNGWS